MCPSASPLVCDSTLASNPTQPERVPSCTKEDFTLEPFWFERGNLAAARMPEWWGGVAGWGVPAQLCMAKAEVAVWKQSLLLHLTSLSLCCLHRVAANWYTIFMLVLCKSHQIQPHTTLLYWIFSLVLGMLLRESSCAPLRAGSFGAQQASVTSLALKSLGHFQGIPYQVLPLQLRTKPVVKQEYGTHSGVCDKQSWIQLSAVVQDLTIIPLIVWGEALAW